MDVLAQNLQSVRVVFTQNIETGTLFKSAGSLLFKVIRRLVYGGKPAVQN